VSIEWPPAMCYASRSKRRDARSTKSSPSFSAGNRRSEYDLPREAVLGYRDTLYPEYRKKIKNTYVPPPPCTADCGVAGNFVRRRSG
jgi:hypothetical protein